ncbi:hypothetical protein PTSG_04967 [Salpingoeca rosetta]|uniref:Uncharacterized protein n=1 Tax=Salpingoeca rosetta (strain ATCC 50818 / BSB-021) TaxID=946362 RepID=F2U951_SALR5|nr:uncharacterized protein PTSG_04967 [Salpingoeca rosetta]EGD73254.1 hypothetical protein PTSG_04967 [Salpingoeca rosetta]|eukprot:XP_004994285.1 hypothetical protein PTSG_04967 [Salpingoeca rosetta]
MPPTPQQERKEQLRRVLAAVSDLEKLEAECQFNAHALHTIKPQHLGLVKGFFSQLLHLRPRDLRSNPQLSKVRAFVLNAATSPFDRALRRAAQPCLEALMNTSAFNSVLLEHVFTLAHQGHPYKHLLSILPRNSITTKAIWNMHASSFFSNRDQPTRNACVLLAWASLPGVSFPPKELEITYIRNYLKSVCEGVELVAERKKGTSLDLVLCVTALLHRLSPKDCSTLARLLRAVIVGNNLLPSPASRHRRKQRRHCRHEHGPAATRPQRNTSTSSASTVIASAVSPSPSPSSSSSSGAAVQRRRQRCDRSRPRQHDASKQSQRHQQQRHRRVRRRHHCHQDQQRGDHGHRRRRRRSRNDTLRPQDVAALGRPRNDASISTITGGSNVSSSSTITATHTDSSTVVVSSRAPAADGSPDGTTNATATGQSPPNGTTTTSSNNGNTRIAAAPSSSAAGAVVGDGWIAEGACARGGYGPHQPEYGGVGTPVGSSVAQDVAVELAATMHARFGPHAYTAVEALGCDRTLLFFTHVQRNVWTRFDPARQLPPYLDTVWLPRNPAFEDCTRHRTDVTRMQQFGCELASPQSGGEGEDNDDGDDDDALIKQFELCAMKLRILSKRYANSKLLLERAEDARPQQSVRVSLPTRHEPSWRPMEQHLDRVIAAYKASQLFAEKMRTTLFDKERDYDHIYGPMRAGFIQSTFPNATYVQRPYNHLERHTNDSIRQTRDYFATAVCARERFENAHRAYQKKYTGHEAQTKHDTVFRALQMRLRGMRARLIPKPKAQPFGGGGGVGGGGGGLNLGALFAKLKVEAQKPKDTPPSVPLEPQRKDQGWKDMFDDDDGLTGLTLEELGQRLEQLQGMMAETGFKQDTAPQQSPYDRQRGSRHPGRPYHHHHHQQQQQQPQQQKEAEEDEETDEQVKTQLRTEYQKCLKLVKTLLE